MLAAFAICKSRIWRLQQYCLRGRVLRTVCKEIHIKEAQRRGPEEKEEREKRTKEKKNQKHTTPRSPQWSPT